MVDGEMVVDIDCWGIVAAKFCCWWPPLMRAGDRWNDDGGWVMWQWVVKFDFVFACTHGGRG